MEQEPDLHYSCRQDHETVVQEPSVLMVPAVMMASPIQTPADFLSAGSLAVTQKRTSSSKKSAAPCNLLRGWLRVGMDKSVDQNSF